MSTLTLCASVVHRFVRTSTVLVGSGRRVSHVLAHPCGEKGWQEKAIIVRRD